MRSRRPPKPRASGRPGFSKSRVASGSENRSVRAKKPESAMRREDSTLRKAPKPETQTYELKGRAAAGGADLALLERLSQQRKVRIKVWKRRVVLFVAAGGAVLFLLWVVFFSSLTAFKSGSCQVRGNHEVSAQEICAAFDSWDGMPLTRMSMTTAQNHLLETVPPIASSRISRQYMHSLSIEVTERFPLVAARFKGKLIGLDFDGVPLERSAQQLSKLPQLEVEVEKLGGVRGKAVSSVLDALGQMDEGLSSQVKSLNTTNGTDLQIKLQNGVQVFWADSGDSALKSKVVNLLLSQGGINHIDVSDPRRPSTY